MSHSMRAGGAPDAKAKENDSYNRMKAKHGEFFRGKYKPADYAPILDKEEQDRLAKIEEEDGFSLTSKEEKLVNGFYRRGKREGDAGERLDLYYEDGSFSPCIDKDKMRSFITSKGFKETWGEVFDAYGAHGTKEIEINWKDKKDVTTTKVIQAMELAHDRGQTIKLGDQVLEYMKTCSPEKRDRILEAQARLVRNQRIEQITSGSYNNENQELKEHTKDLNDLNNTNITSKENYKSQLGTTTDEMLDKIDKGLDELNKRLTVAEQGKDKLTNSISGYEMIADNPEKALKDSAFIKMNKKEQSGSKKKEIGNPSDLLQTTKIQINATKEERDKTVKALDDLTKDLVERRAALKEKIDELKTSLGAAAIPDDKRKKLESLEEKYDKLGEKVRETRAKAEELGTRNKDLPLRVHNTEQELVKKQAAAPGLKG